MDELTDQPVQIKMEELNELSQLIWEEFSDERKEKLGQFDVTENGQTVPTTNGTKMSWSGDVEVTMEHRLNATAGRRKNLPVGTIDSRNTEF